MAVNKVIYDGETLMDVTDSTVSEDTLLSGAVAYNAAGERITGKMVVPPVLTGISIVTPPTKTVYQTDEYFDPAGMTVQAVYSNGTTGTVGGFLYSPTGALSESDTEITVSYMEAGTTVTAKVAITVKGYDDVFANNTWERIIDACQKNRVPDTWVAGNSKTMTINGTDYQIDIIGKNHDVYADGSGTAPLTFQMHDCYNTTYAMRSPSTSFVQWATCDMYTTHLPAILLLMPTAVQNAVREVTKMTGGNYASTTASETTNKLFLLTEIEVFNTTTSTVAGEGSQYAYYAAGNSKAKYRNGTASVWWLRSATKNSSAKFNCVTASGGKNSNSCTSSNGVAFAFCF